MEVIDKAGNVVGRVVKTGATQMCGGRRHAREGVVACLMLPGREPERRVFDSVLEARAWVAREAGG